MNSAGWLACLLVIALELLVFTILLLAKYKAKSCEKMSDFKASLEDKKQCLTRCLSIW